MKNRITFLALITAASLLYSCGKEKNPENTGSRVKTYTEDITNGSDKYSMIFNLSYDGNNRITAITPATSPDDKFTFTYQSNNEYIMELYTSGAVEITEHFFMRNSMLDSTIQVNESNESMSEKYYYDASNRLIQKKEFEQGSDPHLNTIQYTYDAAGNMIKSSDTDGNVETFEYYPELVYIMPAIAPFLQSEKKGNLVKNHTVISYGNVVGSAVSTYTFDSHDRISTVKEISTDGITSVKTFTYF